MLGNKLRICSTTLAATTLALVGCSDTESGLADQNFLGAPVAAVHGTLRVDDATQIEGDVSFALLWLRPGGVFDPTAIPRFPDRPMPACNGQPLPERSSMEGIYNGPGYFAHPGWIAQSVTLEATFPLQFEMPLHNIPPPEALFDLAESEGGTGKYAEASFIVFIDTNGNGEFDPPAAESPADKVLGFAPQILLIYLDGTRAPDNDIPFPQGYSLYTWEVFEDDTFEWQVLSLDYRFAMTIPSSIAEQKEAERRVCTSVVLRDEFGGPLPEKFGENDLFCADDGLSYYYLLPRQMMPDRTCVLVRPFIEACIEPDAVPPEDWPCP